MMKTKKTIIGIIVGGLAFLFIMTAWFATSVQNKQSVQFASPKILSSQSDSLMRLEKSISYLDGKVQFTIPDGNEIWNIQINGRVDVDGIGGMSVHYLSDESENSSWESGKVYAFDVSDGGYTELYLDAGNDWGNISTDIMELLPKNLKAASANKQNE